MNGFKKIMICTLFVGISLCMACSSTMYVKPAALTEKEEKILGLFQDDHAIFDFRLDGSAKRIVFTLYTLENGEWKVVEQETHQSTHDTNGRIGVRCEKFNEGIQIGVQSQSEETISVFKMPDPKTYQNYLSVSLEKQVPVVYDEEFPLIVQVFSDEDGISLGEIKQDMLQSPGDLERENENADIYLFTMMFKKESDTEG